MSIMTSNTPLRSRWVLAFIVLLIILVGLASRSFPFLFPASWGKYPGDVLWATMVYFLIAFLCPKLAPLRLAMMALLVSYAVEFSQIYQGAWLMEIRATRLGHLVLGSGFDQKDLGAYILGVIIAVILDRCYFSRIHE